MSCSGRAEGLLGVPQVPDYRVTVTKPLPHLVLSLFSEVLLHACVKGAVWG